MILAHIAGVPVEETLQPVLIAVLFSAAWLTARLRQKLRVRASISEFERDLIRDRVLAGLKRAKAQGVRLGRPRAVVDVLRARGRRTWSRWAARF